MTLIEELKKMLSEYGDLDTGIKIGLKMAIKIAERHSDWILTSKRCPNDQELKENSEFLVCINGGEVPTALYCYKDDDGTYSWDDYEGNPYNVVAWQNMPKFYKEEVE